VPVVLDYVMVTADSPLLFNMTIAFPLSGQGRPPQKDVFGTRYTARPYLCERFDRSVARHEASREAMRLARSYLVRLFHSRLSSDFAPTHHDPFSPTLNKGASPPSPGHLTISYPGC